MNNNSLPITAIYTLSNVFCLTIVHLVLGDYATENVIMVTTVSIAASNVLTFFLNKWYFNTTQNSIKKANRKDIEEKIKLLDEKINDITSQITNLNDQDPLRAILMDEIQIHSQNRAKLYEEVVGLAQNTAFNVAPAS